ncbi:hypothetical protein EWM64_g10673 [Hericium alpestre]|uniref:Uncharacterized protein n=1 Tax=Hericium alpestre TaxID=135208 RepID=A0A4Y9ZIQ9_9AGAM|nr:hypothetical protein EWM64_g10673 [Hericium alpestre]
MAIPRAHVITGESETYQGVRSENEAHVNDEHMQYIPHGTILVQHAPCPTSHMSHTHVVNPHDMPEPPTYTAQPHATTNGRENEVGAHGEGLYRTNGEYAQSAAPAACPAASAPTFDNALPALSEPGSTLFAITERPNGPVQAPFLTPAGLTAMLAALTACIPVHGPPDAFFACHAPILIHTDPRITVSHKLTKDAADSKPHADPQRPTAR